MLDAGHKAVAVDCGLPTVWQRPDIRYVSASDEHGKLEVGVGNRRAEAGREAAAGARPLRSDGGSLRLVCRGAQRAGRMPVAGRGARRHALGNFGALALVVVSRLQDITAIFMRMLVQSS